MKTILSLIAAAMGVSGCTTFILAPSGVMIAKRAPVERVEAITAHLNDPSNKMDWSVTDDPVVTNLRGVASLLRGDHHEAAAEFRQVLVMTRNRIYLTSDRDLPRFYPEEPKTRSDQRGDPGGRVATTFRLYFTGQATHADVLDALRERQGFLPYPPTYASTAGLTLEAISDDLGRDDVFRPRVVQYYNSAEDSSSQFAKMSAAASVNLAIAGVLSNDIEVVKEAVEHLKLTIINAPDSRFMLGFASWLLQDRSYTIYLNENERNVFSP